MDFAEGNVITANSNSTLQASKKLKDDGFYTTCECIEKELEHYVSQFVNRIVSCKLQ